MSFLKTGEPRHRDGNNKSRPGSQPLNSVVTPALMKEADATWQELSDKSDLRNNRSSLNPNLSEPFSPLETLITTAFEMFGNMSSDTMDGSIKRILLQYANYIVEDVRLHPYTSYPDMDYYVSLQDIRPIPDIIMISGLAFHYAKWYDSSRASTLGFEYIKILNQVMYQRKYGSGAIEMNTVDKTTER